MKKEDIIAKAILNNAYHKALGEVFKAKDGDTKMIFGKPFKMSGGKWVPTSGGGKKEEPKRERPTSSKAKPSITQGYDFNDAKSVAGMRNSWDKIANDPRSTKKLKAMAQNEVDQLDIRLKELSKK